MPDMKEKLVELLTDCEAKGFWYYGKDSKTGEHSGHEMTAEDIADYLVENIGSKWISVKDRLPDETKDEYVLVVCDYYGKITVETRKMWHIDSVVTHWMPLPQPPKGE